jgi:conjugal transfer ATP-binding protein TraC
VGSVETRKGIYSEILVVGRRYYEVARLYVDKFTATMFSSEGDARDLVFELMEQGIPAVDAVHQAMGDKTHSRKQLLELTFNQLRYEDPSLTKADLMSHIAEMMQ